jgi:HIRAN domain.
MTNYNKSAICKTANTLHKRGYTLSQAFVLAWAIAKGTTARVAGTSKFNRQEALRRLTMYSPSETKFTLIREFDNKYDNNAIAVYVSVKGSRLYKIGYVEAYTAYVCACILDKGIDLKADLKTIVGGAFNGMMYGLRIDLRI